METDRNFWFGAIGLLSGLIGTIVGIGGVIYGRRQALAAEGPKSPDLDLLSHGWLPGSNEWYALDVMTKNRTDRHWDMVSARLTLPTGGLLISAEHVTVDDGYGNQIAPPVSDLDPSGLSNVTSPISAVAPVGSSSRFRFMGETDGCREVFYAYIPERLRAESISIEFTLEDKALTVRQIRTTLNRKLKPKASSATE